MNSQSISSIFAFVKQDNNNNNVKSSNHLKNAVTSSLLSQEQQQKQKNNNNSNSNKITKPKAIATTKPIVNMDDVVSTISSPLATKSPIQNTKPSATTKVEEESNVTLDIPALLGKMTISLSDVNEAECKRTIDYNNVL